jgi:hypothetical protein
MKISRIKLAARYFSVHLILSIFIGLISGIIVATKIYPPPFSLVLDVWPIFFLLIGVDIILGPMLTAFLASPKKSRGERNLDFTFVGIVQILALAYGLNSIWTARPAALIFEKDRFVLVRANEILHEPNFSSLRWKIPVIGVLQASTTDAPNNEELMKSIDLASQGISTAMRPSRWEPLPAESEKIVRAAKTIDSLAVTETNKRFLTEARSNGSLSSTTKYYIPLASGQSYDWIVLLNEKYQLSGYLNIDGF